MSLSPCSACNRTPVGKLVAVYAATFESGERVAAKLGYCQPCYVNSPYAGDRALPVADGYVQQPLSCGLCSADLAGVDPAYFYATVYNGGARADLVFGLCPDCGETAQKRLATAHSRLPDRDQDSRQGAGAGGRKARR